MPSTSSKPQLGFTIIEILVALFIFAVIGLISAQLLGRTVDAYEVLDDRGHGLPSVGDVMRESPLVANRGQLAELSRKVEVETAGVVQHRAQTSAPAGV